MAYSKYYGIFAIYSNITKHEVGYFSKIITNIFVTYSNNPKFQKIGQAYVAPHTDILTICSDMYDSSVCTEIGILVTYWSYSGCYTVIDGSPMNLELITGILPAYSLVY